jgi:hypothetical protein
VRILFSLYPLVQLFVKSWQSDGMSLKFMTKLALIFLISGNLAYAFYLIMIQYVSNVNNTFTTLDHD